VVQLELRARAVRRQQREREREGERVEGGRDRERGGREILETSTREGDLHSVAASSKMMSGSFIFLIRITSRRDDEAVG
jgi:hypothetical protein